MKANTFWLIITGSPGCCHNKQVACSHRDKAKADWNTQIGYVLISPLTVHYVIIEGKALLKTCVIDDGPCIAKCRQRFFLELR